MNIHTITQQTIKAHCLKNNNEKNYQTKNVKRIIKVIIVILTVKNNNDND